MTGFAALFGAHGMIRKELPGRGRLRIANTHLTYRLLSPVQLLRLVRRLAADDIPTVIVGDLNMPAPLTGLAAGYAPAVSGHNGDAGKPRDLETKLASLDATPSVIDHLILLRPEDDLSLTGKSKTLWQDAERRGRHARLEAVSLDGFAVLYGFPRFLAALGETLPEGQPLPNLADLLQDRCEKLLEQVCLPVQGG